MNGFMYAFKHSFDFEGRATRREFWTFTFTIWLIGVAFALLRYAMPLAGTLLSILFVLAVLPARLAITWRRLHDTGHSGWWVPAPYAPWALLAPALVGLVWGHGGLFFVSLLVAIAAGLGLIAIAIVVLLFLITESDAGVNAYGPPSPQGEA
jgi:uncharacterized membrane protein YhaH (DUF805 family)